MKQPKKKQLRETRKRPSQLARQTQNPKEDSEALERAVYDGMQDLRMKKAAGT